jgi:peptide/nickel transport system substrate-binding protein
MARSSFRRRIVETLQQDLPVIPIVWYDQIIAVHSRIAGFTVDPFEHRLRLEALTVRA